MIYQNYKIVKKVHNGRMGYSIQIPWSFFFGLFKGWTEVYDYVDTWAGEAGTLVFFDTEDKCHEYMKHQQEKELWK